MITSGGKVDIGWTCEGHTLRDERQMSESLNTAQVICNGGEVNLMGVNSGRAERRANTGATERVRAVSLSPCLSAGRASTHNGGED